MNGFSEEEIKQSVEYQWRMQHIKTYFSLWGIVSGVIVVAMFFVAVTRVNWVKPLVGGVAAVLIYLLIFGSSALHDAVKARKFLKNYKNYKRYDVVLDSPMTSYMYKGAIKYSVRIEDKEICRCVDTNAYFSDMMFSKFTLHEYNNKKVSGLYDEYQDKFYIVGKI